MPLLKICIQFIVNINYAITGTIAGALSTYVDSTYSITIVFIHLSLHMCVYTGSDILCVSDDVQHVTSGGLQPSVDASRAW